MEIQQDKLQLQFKDGNPGAVQYGNFINYYQFHPPEQRISNLPTDIWHSPQENKTFLALDIGCNAGNLTAAILEFLKKNLPASCEIKILAIDIDPILIKRAREQCGNNSIQFECIDCLSEGFNECIEKFLSENSVPISKQKTFDAVFCFSTTMWIHLNSGDSGLKTFLTKVSQIGNILVIEPQPWKCYKSAIKRMKGKLEFPYFKTLIMRNNVVTDIIHFIIDEINMIKIHESPETEWNRQIFCFKHK